MHVRVCVCACVCVYVCDNLIVSKHGVDRLSKISKSFQYMKQRLEIFNKKNMKENVWKKS